METRTKEDMPFLIGLTGTIGTGKSLILSMLRQLGALTLDADWLAQRSYQKGFSGYKAVVAQFGKGILAPGGEIDRGKLGAIVFEDERQLQKLEELIHPIVSASINNILLHPPLPIIAVEAIKLFESGLADICDQIWAVNSSKEVVFQRLQEQRGLSSGEIEDRLRHQSGISEKISLADKVIQNDGDVLDLWKKITILWKSLVGKDPRFAHAVNLSDKLLSHSRKYLLSPGNQCTRKLAGPLRRGSVKGFNENIFQASGSDKYLFFLLCAYSTWLFPSNQQGDVLVICRMKQQQTKIIAASALEDLTRSEIQRITSTIEGYSRLQLHERIFFPFIGKTSYLEDIGYLKIPPREGAKNAGSAMGEYNIYTKSLSPDNGVIKQR